MKYVSSKNTVVASLTLVSALGSWHSITASSPAMYTQQSDIRHALVNEIIKATACAVRKKKTGANELSSYWHIKDVTLEKVTDTDIAHIAHDEKEHFVRSLPLTVKEHIFNELGEMLLNNARPRPFNVSANNLCQWDVFILLTTILLENEPQMDPLVKALHSCFGVKEIWKIQGRLNKPEVCNLIPETFQRRLFATSLQQMMAIKTRISNLIKL